MRQLTGLAAGPHRGPAAGRPPRRPPSGGRSPMDPGSVLALFDGPLGAYVHVPFCERICPFCPYNKVVAEDGLARRYFTGLDRELARYAEELPASGRGAFTSLYVGGGTPTLYPDALERIVAALPVDGERAVEVFPPHGTPDRLAHLAAIGITAVSIGAQSFHDEVLHRLRRPHDAVIARTAVENALGRFATVDVDLIVDVDLQGALVGAFLRDVRACFELGVDQVSAYPLMRFGFTPFGSAHHDRRREHEVLRAVSELAADMGYERRSVWTFNRVGAASYTSITRPRFLGLGAGASSFAGRDFLVNHFGVAQYAEAVEAGRLPVARRFHLGSFAGAGYDLFWQAYTGSIDVAALRPYGHAAPRLAAGGLASLARAGLLRTVPGGYTLTPKGYDHYHDLERRVTYSLIEPLWAEMLTEHVSAPGGGWVRQGRARGGSAWWLARRFFERAV